LEHHDHDDHGTDDAVEHGDHHDDDVIDVEVQEVNTSESAKALPSPATTDAEAEAALWERWLSGPSRRRQEKS
jgi:hypothetical protein